MLRAAKLCPEARHIALPPALLVRASARGQARRFLPAFQQKVFLSQGSKTPVFCRFLSGPWRAHPCPLGLAEWPPPVPVSASKTVPRRVAPSTKEILSVLRNFACAFLLARSRRAHRRYASAATVLTASLLLNYAENLRRQRRADILRSEARGAAQHNRGIKRKHSIS